MKPKNEAPLSAFSVFKRRKDMKAKKKLLKKKSSVSVSPAILQRSVCVTKKRTLSLQDIGNGHRTPSQKLPAAIPSSLDAKRQRRVTHIPACGNAEAEKCFTWLINPHQPSKFFADYWEKKPFCIRNRDPNYYQGIFSCSEFGKVLERNHVEFGKNIDVVTYTDGVRQTFAADGRAYGPVVWHYYENGCSIRLLNPQNFSKSVWKLCSYLQEYFGSFAGANMYLTPPGSQGFAPHYDDIEAFILQIEGRKQWKVYEPRDPTEVLPRNSSRNFSQNEIGEPILEVELEPGDLLYFPRGYIHQAKTPEDAHSLHITVSTYQKHTWGDLMKKVLSDTLDYAMAKDFQYRESLPKDYMEYAGLVNKGGPDRDAFFDKMVQLTKNLTEYMFVDHGADLMAKDFIHSSLPPCLTDRERSCSIHGNGERWENGKVCNAVVLKMNSEIRWIRKRAVRLIREDGKQRLYHSFENTRVYKETEPQYVEISWDLSPAVEMLFESHPNYIKVKDLPLSDEEQQMDIASLLLDKGLIETRFPLQEDEAED